jgi:hypothetical protein
MAESLKLQRNLSPGKGGRTYVLSATFWSTLKMMFLHPDQMLCAVPNPLMQNLSAR